MIKVWCDSSLVNDLPISYSILLANFQSRQTSLLTVYGIKGTQLNYRKFVLQKKVYFYSSTAKLHFYNCIFSLLLQVNTKYTVALLVLDILGLAIYSILNVCKSEI